VLLHIEDSDEVKEQIAFADVILLNKTDLATPAELDTLEARIHAMNSAAKIYRTKDAAIAMDRILDLGGFDLDRALETDPKFLEPEYPFEWSGLYELSPGRYTWTFQPGPDPVIGAFCTKAAQATEAGMRDEVERAVRAFSAPEVDCSPGSELAVDSQFLQLGLEGDHLSFTWVIDKGGAYVWFTEHHPDEFAAQLTNELGVVMQPVVTREYKPDHEHDELVTSVGITTPGDLNLSKFQEWLRVLLATQGPDIFRMKGILSFKGAPQRYVFQGVHMLFDGREDRPWGDEPRRNSLIFIGRNLDREALNQGFQACLV
jgi:G3E family GTPase